jgi:hypothetical protein
MSREVVTRLAERILRDKASSIRRVRDVNAGATGGLTLSALRNGRLRFASQL